jgi:hypothetical protein
VRPSPSSLAVAREVFTFRPSSPTGIAFLPTRLPKRLPTKLPTRLPRLDTRHSASRDGTPRRLASPRSEARDLLPVVATHLSPAARGLRPLPRPRPTSPTNPQPGFALLDDPGDDGRQRCAVPPRVLTSQRYEQSEASRWSSPLRGITRVRTRSSLSLPRLGPTLAAFDLAAHLRTTRRPDASDPLPAPARTPRDRRPAPTSVSHRPLLLRHLTLFSVRISGGRDGDRRAAPPKSIRTPAKTGP